MLEALRKGADARLLARMLGVDYKGALKEAGKDPYDPRNWPSASTLVELVDLVRKGEYPYDTIKGLVLPKLARDPTAPLKAILPEKVESPEALVEEVLRSEEKAVRDYLAGKKKALNYLVGAVMRRARRRAIDPRLVRRLLEERLSRMASG